MGRIALAFRAFWAVLVSPSAAQRLQAALEATALPKIDSVQKPQQPEPAQPPRPARSDALTLLAALQREARLVDLVKQPLTGFSDEEIGAAARNVLADCGAVLDRFFSLQVVATEPEGATCSVPSGYDPACFKLSGRVEGTGPYHGTIVHHGWKATTVNLPTWTGSKNATSIIAPAEVEVS
jgi:hypothetical protein